LINLYKIRVGQFSVSEVGQFWVVISIFQYSVNISDLKIIFGRGENRFMINAEIMDRDKLLLKEISRTMEKDEVKIEIVLGNGPYSEKVWGCDLTEEYININAHYTT